MSVSNGHLATFPSSLRGGVRLPDELPGTLANPYDYWGARLTLAVACVWICGVFIGFSQALTLLVACGFVGLLVGLCWPFVGALSVGLLCTLDAVTRVYLMSGGLLRWNTFNYVLLGVIILAAPALIRRRDLHTWSFVCLIVLLFAQLAYSSDTKRGVLHILNGVSMFGLLAYFIRIHRNSYAWYWMGIVAGTAGGLGGMVYYLQRSSLKYMDPNAVSHFPLAAIFAISLAFFFVREGFWRLAPLGLLAALNFCWVFLTGSRGGTLIATCSLMIVLASMRGLGKRTLLASIAVLIGAVVLTQFSDLQEFATGRILKLFDQRYTISQRTSGRSELAVMAWRMFLEHPYGVGTGGFAVAWEQMSADEGSVFGRGDPYSAHNAWLKTMAENGILGIILMTTFVGSFLLVGFQKRRLNLLPVGLLTSMVLASAFISTEFQAKGLWMLAAAATVLLNRK